jgi:hypothetical protein
MRSIAMLTVAALAAATPGAAQAGAPGEWTRVTPASHVLKNITEIVVDREAATGGLHISWQYDKSVFYDRLEPDLGTLAGLKTITTYSDGLNSEVDLEAIGGTIYAYFAGLEPGTPQDNVLALSQSTDRGQTWSAPAPVSDNRAGTHSPVYASNGLAATHGLDGTLYSIWGSAGSAFHVGSNPSDPDTPLPGKSSTDPGLGVDAQSGQVVAAWNLLDEGGVGVMQLNPPGPRTVIPGSDADQLQTPVSVAGRVGAPGVFVAYSAGDNPFTAKPAVLRFGASSGTILDSNAGARQTALAHTQSGRLWAFWHRADKIYARRSNEAATKWGAIQSIKPPADTTTIWGLTGDALPEPLDLVARIGKGDDIGGWHQRILPKLTLKTKVSRHKVTVTVLDVGDPVAGAAVTVKGAGKKKAGASGKVTFTAAKGKHAVSASAPYGGKATKKVRVR